MAYPDLQGRKPDQRAAVCYGIWKEHRGKAKAAPDLTYGREVAATPPAGWHANDEEFSITFPFAGQSPEGELDREGDYLLLDGVKTEKHKKNPVVYLEHGKHHPLPIGKTESPEGTYTVWKDDATGLMWGKAYLDRDMPEARQAFDLYKKKILRAGSLGYRILKAKQLPPDPANGHPRARLLKEVELWEASLVGVPANPDCVVDPDDYAPAFKSILAKAAVSPAMSAVAQASGGALVADVIEAPDYIQAVHAIRKALKDADREEEYGHHLDRIEEKLKSLDDPGEEPKPDADAAPKPPEEHDKWAYPGDGGKDAPRRKDADRAEAPSADEHLPDLGEHAHAVKMAACHLDDQAEREADRTWKAAHLHHAKALHMACSAMKDEDVEREVRHADDNDQEAQEMKALEKALARIDTSIKATEARLNAHLAR